MMPKETIEGYFPLQGGEFTHAGSSATEIKTALSRIGVSPEIARRAGISAFEAEMNVIIHAVAGSLRYEVSNGVLTITVTDMGPGIPDVAQAMQPGFTTAPEWAKEKGWGSGLGLPNIEKNCDNLKIDTVLGEGTTLEITINLDGQGNNPGGKA